VTLRLCNKCSCQKPPAEFYKYPNGAPRAICKSCENAASRAWMKKHAEHKKQYDRERRSRNRVAENASSRDWKKRHPAYWRAASLYVARFPDKLNARRAVRDAVRRGRIVKGPCETCSSTTRVEGHHHRGYARDRRLDVRWLCRSCHRQEHAKGLQ